MRPLNWIQWLTLAMVVALAVVVPLNLIEINQARSQNSRAIRTVLCYFESRAPKQAVAVYQNALAQIGEPACEEKKP